MRQVATCDGRSTDRGRWLGRATLTVVALTCLAACPPAHASLQVDVRVLGVTGSGSSFNPKAATIPEGGSVTVGLYISGLGPNGVATFCGSLRTSAESADAMPWPVNPAPADTVLNATSYFNNLDVASGGMIGTPAGAHFVLPAGSLADLNAAISNPDPNDTDVDVLAVCASQISGDGVANLVGIGAADAEALMFTGTFTALELDDLLRGTLRTAVINTLFTGASGTSGGLVVRELTAGGVDDGAPSTINSASADAIGAPVIVTVVAPEPAALLGLAAKILLILARRPRGRA